MAKQMIAKKRVQSSQAVIAGNAASIGLPAIRQIRYAATGIATSITRAEMIILFDCDRVS